MIEAHTRAQGEPWTFGGLARFVMVARDTVSGNAAPVAALLPQTQQQKNLSALGHYNRYVLLLMCSLALTSLKSSALEKPNLIGSRGKKITYGMTLADASA